MVPGLTGGASAAPRPSIEVMEGQGLPDVDARSGSKAPTAAARSIVTWLRAHVTWNRFGTPASLIRYGGYLETGVPGKHATQAARNWVGEHKALFRLTSADESQLELLNDSPMVGSKGHAVLFRQLFGKLPAAQDGMIMVGLTGSRGSWKIAYASSSSAGTQSAPAAAELTARQAWLQAAGSIGRNVNPQDISGVHQDDGWTVFSVHGFATPAVDAGSETLPVGQRARPVALPTYTDGVRPAYETVVLDVGGGKAEAYTIYVDAVTGKILMRLNRVDQITSGLGAGVTPTTSQNGTFSGTTPDQGTCGPEHHFAVDQANKQIDVVASADVPANDIVLNLLDPNGNVKASSDTGTSPETVSYQLSDGDPRGQWAAQVCEFAEVQGFAYHGAYFTSDNSTGNVYPYPPEWKYFTLSPAARRLAPAVPHARHRQPHRGLLGEDRRGAGVPTRGDEPGLQSPLGLRPRDELPHLHDERQQRRDGRGVALAADAGRDRAEAVRADPSLPRAVAERVERREV
jgi:hypothetical protein